jgi:hypothetical protein
VILTSPVDTEPPVGPPEGLPGLVFIAGVMLAFVAIVVWFVWSSRRR